jgi:hypothetical protein
MVVTFHEPFLGVVLDEDPDLALGKGELAEADAAIGTAPSASA